MKNRPLLFDDPPPPAGAARVDPPPPATAAAAPARLPPAGLVRGLLLVLLIFVATRLVVWVAAYSGALMLFRIENGLAPPWERHLRPMAAAMGAADSPVRQRAGEILGDFAPLCRFDGGHYRSIIEGGYRYVPPAPGETDRGKLEQNIAFFPLYPLLCRPLAPALGTFPAMVLVSHVAALGAAVLLYLWLRSRIDEATALTAVALLLALPSACYFSFGYAESTTLVLSAATLWLLDARRFGSAAVCSGLATASRPTALALALVTALAYWCNGPGDRAHRLRRLVPLSLVAAGGLIAYALFLTVQYGSPLVYLANFKAGWVPDAMRADWFQYLTLARVWDQFKYLGRALEGFPVGLVQLANPFAWNMPLNLSLLAVSLAGLPRVPRSFRPLLALPPLVFLHAYLASGGATFGIEPIGRYMGVSLPAIAVLAAWMVREWRWGGRAALLAFFILLQAAWAFRFGLDEWSG